MEVSLPSVWLERGHACEHCSYTVLTVWRISVDGCASAQCLDWNWKWSRRLAKSGNGVPSARCVNISGTEIDSFYPECNTMVHPARVRDVLVKCVFICGINHLMFVHSCALAQALLHALLGFVCVHNSLPGLVCCVQAAAGFTSLIKGCYKTLFWCHVGHVQVQVLNHGTCSVVSPPFS